MARQHSILRFLALCLFIALCPTIQGCANALRPEQTPQRVIINFLKAAGRGNIAGAEAFVVPESRSQIPSWVSQLFFPDHASPPTSDEEAKVDQFIGQFFRIAAINQPAKTDTEVQARLTFAATDAMVGFPSVANNPLVPNSALYVVTLRRTVTGEGDKAKPGEWLIALISPTSDRR